MRIPHHGKPWRKELTHDACADVVPVVFLAALDNLLVQSWECSWEAIIKEELQTKPDAKRGCDDWAVVHYRRHKVVPYILNESLRHV